MGVHDPDGAAASWRHSVSLYDQWRDTEHWCYIQTLHRFVRCVAASDVAQRYFASQSHGCLGISTYPTWEQRRDAPILWVSLRPGAEGDDVRFEFELYGRDHRPKGRSAPIAEADAVAMLGEWLAKLEVEPGA